MIATLLYMFFNFFFFEHFIISKANQDEAKQHYKSAITYYKIAGLYYKYNHSSNLNKKIFMEISYKIAICELKNNNKEGANKSLRQDLTKIQNKYGIYSKETASFIRQYLIPFYFIDKNLTFVQQEFDNALNIYSKIGYDKNTMADLIRIGGDLYYEKKQYPTAIVLYENAYKTIYKQPQMDYEVFAKIVNRICEYQVQNNNSDTAINLYKNSIETLKNAKPKQNEAIAGMLINLGDLYSKDDSTTLSAINCYEEAIGIIKKLSQYSELKQNINTYLLTLKDLYTKSNQPQKASKIETELTRRKRFSFLY